MKDLKSMSEKYVDLAITTECDNDEVLKRLWKGYSKFADNKQEFLAARSLVRLIHGSMGISSEIRELKEAVNTCMKENNPKNRLKAADETGDFFWYLSVILNVVHMDLEKVLKAVPFKGQYSERDIDLCFESISEGSSILSDIIKKNVFYGKEYLYKDLEQGVHSVIFGLLGICSIFKMDVNKDVLAPNIKKLKSRYSSKFTEDRAINKNPEKEYKSMES